MNSIAKILTLLLTIFFSGCASTGGGYLTSTQECAMPHISEIKKNSEEFDDALFGAMKAHGYSGFQRQKVQNQLEYRKQLAYADIVEACRVGGATPEILANIKIKYYQEYKRLQSLVIESNKQGLPLPAEFN